MRLTASAWPTVFRVLAGESGIGENGGQVEQQSTKAGNIGQIVTVWQSGKRCL